MDHLSSASFLPTNSRLDQPTSPNDPCHSFCQLIQRLTMGLVVQYIEAEYQGLVAYGYRLEYVLKEKMSILIDQIHEYLSSFLDSQTYSQIDLNTRARVYGRCKTRGRSQLRWRLWMEGKDTYVQNLTLVFFLIFITSDHGHLKTSSPFFL